MSNCRWILFSELNPFPEVLRKDSKCRWLIIRTVDGDKFMHFKAAYTDKDELCLGYDAPGRIYLDKSKYEYLEEN